MRRKRACRKAGKQKALQNALGGAQPMGCEVLQGRFYYSTRIQKCLARVFVLLCIAMPALQAASAPAVPEGFIVRHGNRGASKVAITIDDCYDRKHIQAAIDLCVTHDIPVTFFPVGNALKYADGELWQNALDAGCEIGNHSWGHKNLTDLNAHQVKFQMLRTQEKLDAMLGYHYPMQVMRPPYGTANNAVAEALKAIDYQKIVKWDVSQTDASKAILDVQNGSILLYHGRARDIRCLKTLIPQLLEQGYECVTVSELLMIPPVATSTDLYVYRSSGTEE